MNMAKRPVPQYDFKAFGAAIKAARLERKERRKKVCDEMYLSLRYLANIENKGQHPSLQIFFELMLRYNISVDQFLLERSTGKNTSLSPCLRMWWTTTTAKACLSAKSLSSDMFPQSLAQALSLDAVRTFCKVSMTMSRVPGRSKDKSGRLRKRQSDRKQGMAVVMLFILWCK